MSCPHGNWGECEQCAAIDAMYAQLATLSAERDELREQMHAVRNEFIAECNKAAVLTASVAQLEEALRKAESRLSDIAENTDCWGVYQMAIHARQGAEEARAALRGDAT